MVMEELTQNRQILIALNGEGCSHALVICGCTNNETSATIKLVDSNIKDKVYSIVWFDSKYTRLSLAYSLKGKVAKSG